MKALTPSVNPSPTPPDIGDHHRDTDGHRFELCGAPTFTQTREHEDVGRPECFEHLSARTCPAQAHVLLQPEVTDGRTHAHERAGFPAKDLVRDVDASLPNLTHGLKRVLIPLHPVQVSDTDHPQGARTGLDAWRSVATPPRPGAGQKKLVSTPQ